MWKGLKVEVSSQMTTLGEVRESKRRAVWGKDKDSWRGNHSSLCRRNRFMKVKGAGGQKQAWDVSLFWILAILIDVWPYLIAVLICSSLTTKMWSSFSCAYLPPVSCLFFFFLFFFFFGPHLWDMEVPRLGVQLEPQLPAYTTATATRIRATSVIYTTAHTRSWARPGIEPST